MNITGGSAMQRFTILDGSPLPWLPVIDTDEWEQAAVSLFTELVSISERTPPDPLLTARGLRMAVRNLPPKSRLVASLALEDHWPQQIIVEAGAPDTRIDTGVLAGALVRGPFGLPDVDDDEPGTVIVTSRELLDDASVTITVCVVRRTPALDVRIVWQTTALDLVEVVRPELVALSSALRVDGGPS